MDTQRNYDLIDEEVAKQQYWYNQMTARQRKKYIPKAYRFSSLITTALTNKKR